MAFTLVNAGPSPFGRKVAIALVEKGLPYEVRYDLPWGEGTCTPEFSPLEQLPILVTETGEHIYDSAYIVDWLEQRYPQPALLPAQLEQRLEAQQRRLLANRHLLMEFEGSGRLRRRGRQSWWVGPEVTLGQRRQGPRR